MSSFFAVVFTALLLSFTSFFMHSLSVLHLVFWFAVWFVLLILSCYISAKVYVFLVQFSGYRCFFRAGFAVYGGLLWRLIPSLAVQVLVEIFADYIIWGNFLADLLFAFNLLLYIFLLFRYLPVKLPWIVKNFFIVCSFLPQAMAFYFLIK